MRGYLLLSEARSGSNWLGTLAESTGEMGHLEEWFLPQRLGTDLHTLSWPAFIDRVFQGSSTLNGRFAVKIFPNQLQAASRHFGLDFIAETCKTHETAVIFLHRRDRIRQAISLARARSTQQWRSGYENQGVAKYDFLDICACYSQIEQSNGYWRSYLDLSGLHYKEFVYEDLLADHSSYFKHLSDVLDVPISRPLETALRIQRDDTTEDWLQRFRTELGSRNIADLCGYRRPAARNMTNLWRFLRKKAIS